MHSIQLGSFPDRKIIILFAPFVRFSKNIVHVCFATTDQ